MPRRGRHAVTSILTPSARLPRLAVPSSSVSDTRPRPSPWLRTIARMPTARTASFDGRGGSWTNRRDVKLGAGTETSRAAALGQAPNPTEAIHGGGEAAPDGATPAPLAQPAYYRTLAAADGQTRRRAGGRAERPSSGLRRCDRRGQVARFPSRGRPDAGAARSRAGWMAVKSPPDPATT